MNRIYLLSLIFLFHNLCAFAQSGKINTKDAIEVIFNLYEEAKYDEAISALDKIQSKVADHLKARKDMQGLIYYWKGLCYVKMNEYDLAKDFLRKTIDLNFQSPDLFYEYGQVLYVLEELKDARIAFKKSVKAKYKMGVSLYYIAYISQQLKDDKGAVTFYNAIEKLPDEDKKDVIQAARMQVADIYLKQVEKMPDTFRSVEKYVIPQYEKALEWNSESKLADDIRDRIKKIQKRYDLILFKMRNGVPTAEPRYYLKGSFTYGVDDNVNSASSDTNASLNAEDYASGFMNSNLFGRYSFYPNSTFSLSPEFTLDHMKYTSDSDNIKVNNSLGYTVGLQINYEHLYNEAPATFFINIDYNYLEDDADADDTLEKSSTTNSVTLSESLQIWQGNPSTFRYKFSQTTAEVESNSSSTQSLIWEQVLNLGNQTFFFYNSFDMTRYPEAQTSDTNSLLIRCDWILPTLWGAINPNFYFSEKLTNYIENTDRGVTSLLSYGMSLNRPVSSKWYLTIDYGMESQSGKDDNDVYQGTKYSLNLSYIY